MDLSDLVEKTLARRRRSGALRIVQAGHPALRARARTWDGQLDDDLLADLVEAMVRTMREAPGVGLAAPQVGIPLRLAVLEDPFAPEAHEAEEEDRLLERRPLALRVLLDPEYEVIGRRRVMFWEGCLSVDGWQSIIPRAERVRLRATERTADGRLLPLEEEWSGWQARIAQHETDHLAGTLCHDLGVPRSFVAAPYASRLEDLAEARRRLGLTGEIEDLAPGQVAYTVSASPTSTASKEHHR